MSGSNWREAMKLFSEAVELSIPERELLMARLEPTLREAVEQLLTADLEPGGLLERGPVHLASQAATALTGGFKNVGTYRILRLTGRGGMGTVYEAQQESPKHIVALKVIRADLGGLESVGRFVREVEILGRLQHPGIANIYDAGIADGGAGPQRYLAMEFVQGKDLVEAGGGLPVRARIGLFMKVCDAVQHAHSRGVIHRDLKPRNILVNGEGEPKILDFGVARMIERDVHDTFRTEAGQLIGTLAYMSPEQAEGGPNGIDVRTDVYSLGVVLYELLAGKLPYRTKGVAVLEAVRVVQEEDAAPLRSVDRSFRGDLDTISTKALEKDRTQRYASAGELREDLRRYLAGEPIAERGTRIGYRLSKLVRRNMRGLAVAAAVTAILIGAGIFSAAQSLRARNADSEAAATRAVSNFLRSNIAGQRRRKTDPEITVAAVLDRAAARAGARFKDQPELEAALRVTIAKDYAALGSYREAATQIDRAVELLQRRFGRESPKAMEAMAARRAIASQQQVLP